jgi:DNA-binding SARP family transcriptional activator
MRDDVMIRVLGPIDIVASSSSVAVGGRQARAPLGALVIGVGHAVSIDQLEEVLWGGDCPGSADNTLQSYVSHLRGLLGADAIVRSNHAYLLAAGTDNIDAQRFEVLLRHAAASRERPEECSRYCAEALQLWRGRPFGDLADEEPFRLESHRLDELRLGAMEYMLEAELALGRHDLVVGELESAVEEHPFRERLWCLLIEALASSGRRVEALRTVERLRLVLADVGLEVSDEVRSLEQHVLTGWRISDDLPLGQGRSKA